MQNQRKRILTIALIMVVVVAGGISATLVMAGGGPKERPFNATQQGTFTFFNDAEIAIDDDCAFLAPPGPPVDTTCSVALEGSGTATHLGAYTEVGNWLNPVNLADPCGEIGTGNIILTASNGDELHVEPVEGTASICPAGPPDENGILLGAINDAPFTVTGGTGRFEGATGSFVRNGAFDLNVVTHIGTFDVTYEGTITY